MINHTRPIHIYYHSIALSKSGHPFYSPRKFTERVIADNFRDSTRSLALAIWSQNWMTPNLFFFNSGSAKLIVPDPVEEEGYQSREALIQPVVRTKNSRTLGVLICDNVVVIDGNPSTSEINHEGDKLRSPMRLRTI